jgi:hypothetical protein
MTRAQVSTIALIALLTTLPTPALAGDVILSGTRGEKTGRRHGLSKAEGQTTAPMRLPPSVDMKALTRWPAIPRLPIRRGSPAMQ